MKLQGILVASAALGILFAGTSFAQEEGAEGGQVKCAGINGCSGKGECAAADGSHDCSGKNGCQGKGWVHAASAEECTEKGGTVLEG